MSPSQSDTESRIAELEAEVERQRARADRLSDRGFDLAHTLMTERNDFYRAQDQLEARNEVIADLIGQRNRAFQKINGEKEAIRRMEVALKKRNKHIAELERDHANLITQYARLLISGRHV